MARQLEVMIGRGEFSTGPDHVDLQSADGSRDPDSGRSALTPAPALLVLARYLVRARRYADKTQHQLAADTGISQPSVSRIERALAPAMRLERFVQLGQGLGRLFPLGFCPHEHDCAWQPVRPPERTISDARRLLSYLQKVAGDATRRTASPAAQSGPRRARPDPRADRRPGGRDR